MLSDDELCKFIQGNSGEVATHLITSSDDTSASPEPNPKPQKAVILRKIFTITTLKIYPDGQVYVHESHSWIDKDTSVYRKKSKKAPKRIKPTSVKLAEVL